MTIKYQDTKFHDQEMPKNISASQNPTFLAYEMCVVFA